MKVAPAAYQQNQSQMASNKILLPLVPTMDTEELSKTNSITFELRSIPTDADSAKYKVIVRILQGTEDLRTIITFRKDVAKVLAGLNLTTYATQVPILRSMMRSNPLASFNAALTDAASEAMMTAALAARQAAADGGGDAAAQTTAYNAEIARGPAFFQNVNQITPALNYALRDLIPRKTEARVKRTLRRFMRKPPDMKVRTYVQHIWRINTEEIPYIPTAPDAANAPAPLSEDEILDIVLHNTPNSWEKEMDRQRFDPVSHSLMEVVDFMEGIETAEDFNGTTVPKKPAKKNSSNNKSLTSSMEKYCMLHGKGSHSTEECQKLKAEAKRLKSGTYSSGDSKPKFSKNKSWSRKANDGKEKTKSDLNAIVNKAIKAGIKAGVQKELNAIDKKRKSEEAAEDELNLADFDYSDMEKLSIEEGEVEC